MPWKALSPMDERVRFVGECLKDEATIADLCREFAISRKTGYKWKNRYEAEGAAGLEERSRASAVHPNATPDEVVEAILEVRRSHMTWGPRKVAAWLQANRRELKTPAPSTIGEILSRYGLVKARKRRPKTTAQRAGLLTEPKKANDVWGGDHKGQFKTGDGIYCYPLTVSDLHTRFLLACAGKESTDLENSRPVFEEAFGRYGLPGIIRTDNGPPFASKAPRGLTRLSVWWLKLGIRHETIDPGHPEQNGSHERMHRTLKAEVKIAKNLTAQQKNLDVFRDEFNNDRPHEAIAMRTPASIYKSSPRHYANAEDEFEYPPNYRVRRVASTGRFRWPGRHVILVGAPLVGELVGCNQVSESLWEVFLGPLQLGLIDTMRLEMGLIRVDRPRDAWQG